METPHSDNQPAHKPPGRPASQPFRDDPDLLDTIDKPIAIVERHSPGEPARLAKTNFTLRETFGVAPQPGAPAGDTFEGLDTLLANIPAQGRGAAEGQIGVRMPSGASAKASASARTADGRRVTLTLTPTTDDGVDSLGRWLQILDDLPYASALHRGRDLVFANDAMRALTGYPRAEIVSGPQGFFIDPDDLPRLTSCLDTPDNQASPVEYWIVTKQGQRRHIHTTPMPFAPANGLRLMISVDITEREQAQSDLRRVSFEFDTLARNVDSCVVRVDRNFRCLYANANAEAFLGVDAGTLVGRDLRAVMDGEPALEKFKQLIIKSVAMQKELVRQHRAPVRGMTRDMEVRVIPEAVDSRPEQQTMMVILQDHTEALRLDDERAKARRYLDTLAQQCDAVLWTMGLDGRLRYVSKSVAGILGYTPEEYLARGLRDTIDIGTADALRLTIDQIAMRMRLSESEKLLKDYELEFRETTQGKQQKSIRATMMVVEPPDGAQPYILGVSRDVTRLRETERGLAHEARKAVVKESRYIALFYKAGADIRARAAAIMAAQTTPAGASRDTAPGAARLLTTRRHIFCVDKMLVDIELIFSLENGTKTLRRERFDLSTFVSDMIRKYGKQVITTWSTEVRVDGQPPAEPMHVETDRAALEAAVANILMGIANALVNGTIQVSFHRDSQGQAQIRFAASQPDKRFDALAARFAAASADTHAGERPEDRMELPFILSGALLRALGTPMVAGKDDDGLPYLAFTPPGVPEQEPAAGKASTRTYDLLVAEDDDSNYQLIRAILAAGPYQISRACDGAEAVAMARDNNYDLVLMDLRMPRMDGFQASKLIKRRQPGIPIIAQTAYADYNDVVNALDSGFDDFIAKPMTAKKLRKMVERYTGQ